MSIEPGDRVLLDYVGRFPDGSVFATSREAIAAEHHLSGEDTTDGVGPLGFTVGEGEVIDGLDVAVLGLAEGDTRTVEIEPEEAYGPYRPDRVREYDPEPFEAMVGESPTVGLHVEAHNGLHGDVTAVSEDAVEVDFNHELAGKTLILDIEVLRVA